MTEKDFIVYGGRDSPLGYSIAHWLINEKKHTGWCICKGLTKEELNNDKLNSAATKGVKVANLIITKWPFELKPDRKDKYETILNGVDRSENLLEEFYKSIGNTSAWIGKANTGFRQCINPNEKQLLYDLKVPIQLDGTRWQAVQEFIQQIEKSGGYQPIGLNNLIAFNESVWDINGYVKSLRRRLADDVKDIKDMKIMDSAGKVKVRITYNDDTVEDVLTGKLIVCLGVGNIAFAIDNGLNVNFDNLGLFTYYKYMNYTGNQYGAIPPWLSSFCWPEKGVCFTNEQGNALSVLDGLAQNHISANDFYALNLLEQKALKEKNLNTKFPQQAFNPQAGYICTMTANPVVFNMEPEKYFEIICSKPEGHSNISFNNLMYYTTIRSSISKLENGLNHF